MILVLNAGSSSLKFHLYEGEQLVSAGAVGPGAVGPEAVGPEAIAEVFRQVGDVPVEAVGHRVVHGGSRFTESVVIDVAVEEAIAELSNLAPLHNPHSLEAYRAARERLPNAIHVAAFDTAFHQTLPPRAYTYGVPPAFGIRRYGFHGISHRYIAGQFPNPEARLISCHLGNGSSVCAISAGRSVDTSMGFTPLEGLVMGTRCGDLDPGALLYLMEHCGMTAADLAFTLNHESGLLGLSGTSADMRDLLTAEARGDARAALAIDVYCYRVRKYIGAYLAALNGADAIIFTAGIGENAPQIRARICASLDGLGITTDATANAAGNQDSRQIGFGQTAVWVIPTDEELLIARDTRRLLHAFSH